MKETEEALNHWGEWCRLEIMDGWIPASVVGLLDAESAVLKKGRKGTLNYPVNPDPVAERMKEIMLGIRKQFPQEGEILVRHYYVEGHSQRQIARQMQTTLSTIYTRLRGGRMCVAGAITGYHLSEKRMTD